VRQLNPAAHLVVAVRQEDNVPLALQSGADNVVTSSESVGRLVGLSSLNPNLSRVVEDLLSHGDGLDVCQRPITADEIGFSPSEVTAEPVLAVFREGMLCRYTDPLVSKLQAGDELVVVRDTTDGSCEGLLRAR
jgi:voltage-gated potassium channel